MEHDRECLDRIGKNDREAYGLEGECGASRNVADFEALGGRANVLYAELLPERCNVSAEPSRMHNALTEAGSERCRW